MTDAVLLDAVETAHAEWFRYQDGVAGIEVHDDPDATWMVTTGIAWANLAVRLRFGVDVAEPIDAIRARHASTGRGAGFWVSSVTTPDAATVEAALRARGFRCRKRLPVMVAALPGSAPLPPAGVTLAAVDDYREFETVEHPAVGRPTTAIRRQALAKRAALAGRVPRRAVELVARDPDGTPLGSAIAWLPEGPMALVLDVAVVASHRRRGIGGALVRGVMAVARAQGYDHAALVSSADGESVYHAAGFREVGRFASWYSRTPGVVRPDGRLAPRARRRG